MDGSRLLLVCDVALGRCRDVLQRDATLTQAPKGHHSIHGVRHTAIARSDFEVRVKVSLMLFKTIWTKHTD